MKHHKLVRDKIPEIMIKSGKKINFRVLDHAEYRKYLDQKLQEEVEEYLQSQEIMELADILEVVYALDHTHETSTLELDKLRRKKAQQRGGFKKRFYLIDSAD